MSASALLWRPLLVFLCGFVLFLIVRAVCTRLSEQSVKSDETTVVYRRVLTYRLVALAFCFLALVAWFLESGWLFCLPFAGLGCYALFLAYRLRTRHTLHKLQYQQR